jgi:hypothetical protein
MDETVGEQERGASAPREGYSLHRVRGPVDAELDQRALFRRVDGHRCATEGSIFRVHGSVALTTSEVMG